MTLALGLGLGLPFTRSTGGGYNPITALGDDLLEWWEAGQGMTLAGSAVSAWEGRKNGYTVTQSLSASRPIYSATSFGGAPGLTLDGTDDVLNLESVPFPTGATPWEVWIVAQQNALAADATVRVAFSCGSVVASARRVQRGVATGTNRGQASIGDGASATGQTEGTVNLSSRHLMRAAVGASETLFSVDGVDAAPISVVPNTSSTRVNIGANTGTQAGGNFWHGLIRDIIVTNPLTNDQADALEAFLLERRAL